MSAEVAAVLRRAAARITAETWCQHYSTKGEQHCAGGWIGVEGGEVFGSRTYDAFAEFLGQPITTFNDTPGRQWHEVRDALLAAADRVEAQS